MSNIKPKFFIIYGPPGSGKTTQAKILVKKLNFKLLVIGDLLRKFSRKRTDLGRKIKAILEKGELVGDKIVFLILKTELINLLKKKPKGIILDGFPRTLGQARKLNSFIKANDFPLPYVIHLKVPKREIKKRLNKRRVCEKCGKIYTIPCPKNCSCGGRLIRRSDETPQAIEKRYEIYQLQQKLLSQFYKGRIIPIRSVGEIDEISKKIIERIREIND